MTVWKGYVRYERKLRQAGRYFARKLRWRVAEAMQKWKMLSLSRAKRVKEMLKREAVHHLSLQRWAFSCMHNEVRDKKKKEQLRVRILKRWRDSLLFSAFDGWYEYAWMRREGREKKKRLVQGMLVLLCAKAMNTWKVYAKRRGDVRRRMKEEMRRALMMGREGELRQDLLLPSSVGMEWYSGKDVEVREEEGEREEEEEKGGSDIDRCANTKRGEEVRRREEGGESEGDGEGQEGERYILPRYVGLFPLYFGRTEQRRQWQLSNYTSSYLPAPPSLIPPSSRPFLPPTSTTSTSPALRSTHTTSLSVSGGERSGSKNEQGQAYVCCPPLTSLPLSFSPISSLPLSTPSTFSFVSGSPLIPALSKGTAQYYSALSWCERGCAGDVEDGEVVRKTRVKLRCFQVDTTSTVWEIW
uniref:Sfi1 spindle body domain-containing protein n=1 Tax=Palpitomonas bilix TaxID=652834 RepID=A0A7S3GGL3_9EUKA